MWTTFAPLPLSTPCGPERGRSQSKGLAGPIDGKEGPGGVKSLIAETPQPAHAAVPYRRWFPKKSNGCRVSLNNCPPRSSDAEVPCRIGRVGRWKVSSQERHHHRPLAIATQPPAATGLNVNAPIALAQPVPIYALPIFAKPVMSPFPFSLGNDVSSPSRSNAAFPRCDRSKNVCATIESAVNEYHQHAAHDG